MRSSRERACAFHAAFDVRAITQRCCCQGRVGGGGSAAGFYLMPLQQSFALAGQSTFLVNSDLVIALVMCAATLIASYGLWRLVHVRHSGPILAGMAILAVVLMIAPGSIPGVPRQVVAVGFVLAIVVTFGVLYWRHRDEDGDWADVARVRYIKPVAQSELGQQSPAFCFVSPSSVRRAFHFERDFLPHGCFPSPGSSSFADGHQRIGPIRTVDSLIHRRASAFLLGTRCRLTNAEAVKEFIDL